MSKTDFFPPRILPQSNAAKYLKLMFKALDQHNEFYVPFTSSTVHCHFVSKSNFLLIQHAIAGHYPVTGSHDTRWQVVKLANKQIK